MPFWPTYTFPQSGHVSLQTPELVNLSSQCVLLDRWLCCVLLVRKAICSLECLNKFVMYLVSLPE
jgi:hypothetical protein